MRLEILLVGGVLKESTVVGNVLLLFFLNLAWDSFNLEVLLVFTYFGVLDIMRLEVKLESGLGNVVGVFLVGSLVLGL